MLFKRKHQEKNIEQPFLSREKVDRDWEIMLGIFLLVVIIGAIIDGFLFFKVNEGEAFDPNTVQAGSIVDRKAFTETIDFFEGRYKEYEFLKTAEPNEIDPSF